MLLNFIATAAQPAGRAPVMIWLPFIFVIAIFWVLDFFTRKKNKKNWLVNLQKYIMYIYNKI